MRRTSACLLLVAVLGGCAPGMGAAPWVFEKEGVTEAQVKSDRAECFAESVESSSVIGGATMRVDREQFRACMLRLGYRVRVSMMDTTARLGRTAE